MVKKVFMIAVFSLFVIQLWAQRAKTNSDGTYIIEDGNISIVISGITKLDTIKVPGSFGKLNDADCFYLGKSPITIKVKPMKTSVEVIDSDSFNVSANDNIEEKRINYVVKPTGSFGPGDTPSVNYSCITLYFNNDSTPPNKPTVTSTTTQWTKSSVTVTASSSDEGGSGIDYYQYSTDNKSTWTRGNSCIFNANGTVYFKAFDIVGNESAVSDGFTVDNIDKTAPDKPTLTSSTTDWTNSSVTVTAESTDSASGIDYYQYSTDNKSTWTRGNSCTFNANGTVYFKAFDIVGNESAVSDGFTVDNIDKTSPTNPEMTVSTTDWTNSSVTVTANSTDSASGIDYYQYSTDNKKTWTEGDSCTLDANGTVYFKAFDKAGNESAVSEGLSVANIDKIPPTKLTLTTSTTDWTNSSVTVTAESTDSASGIDYYHYSTDNKITWTKGDSCTLNANGTVNFKAFDKAGNVSSIEQISVNNIDKVVPTMQTLTATATDWTNSDVTITASATDDSSGVSYYEYSTDNKNTWSANRSCTVTTEGQTTVYSKAIDEAGNSSVESNTIVKIDKTDPDISVNMTISDGNNSVPYNGKWTNKNVTVNLQLSDVLSGINIDSLIITGTHDGTDEPINFRNDSTDNEIVYTILLTADGEYDLSVSVSDNAGNTTAVNKTVRIDRKEIGKSAVKITPGYSASVSEFRKGLECDETSFSGDLQKIYVEVAEQSEYISNPYKLILEIDGKDDKKEEYEYSFPQKNAAGKFVCEINVLELKKNDTTPGLTEGVHEINISIIDEAGNKQTVSNQFTKEVTIDRTANPITAGNITAEFDVKQENMIITVSNAADSYWVICYDDSEDFKKYVLEPKKKTDVYYKSVGKSQTNAKTSTISRKIKPDGVYTLYLVNVDMYGNYSSQTLYLMYRKGESVDTSKIKADYENTKDGLSSFIELETDINSATVDKKEREYKKTFYLVGSNGKSIVKTSNESSIKIYTSELKKILNWNENDDKLKIDIYYDEVYEVPANEKDKIQTIKWSGKNLRTTYKINDKAPVFNPNLDWPELAGSTIILTNNMPDEYDGFKKKVEDPDGDSLLFKVIFEDGNGEKVIYMESLDVGIKFPEGLDCSKGVTITVKAKGVRKESGGTWRDEGSETIWSKTKTYTEDTVDLSSPTITPEDVSYWTSNWNSKTSSKFNISDEGTGLQSIVCSYYKDGDKKNINTITVPLDGEPTYEYDADFSKYFDSLSGNYKFDITVSDRSGNSSSAQYSVKIDNMNPEIKSVTPVTETDGTVKLEIVADDGSGSGVNKYRTKTDDEEDWSDWKSYPIGSSVYVTPDRFSGNKRIVKIQLKDRTCNESAEESITSDDYNPIPEVSVSVSGMNDNEYVTNIDELNLNLTFSDDSSVVLFTQEYTLTDKNTGDIKVYETLEKLKSSLEDGKEYSLSIKLTNQTGCSTNVCIDQTIRIKTEKPSDITLESEKTIIKGRRHEIKVKGGLDKTGDVKRTLYTARKTENDDYEILDVIELETDIEEEVVRIPAGLRETEIESDNFYVYAKSVNEAGLLTESEVIGNFKLKTETGLYVEADEYTSGALFVRWDTKNEETADYKYTVTDEDGKSLYESTTSDKYAVCQVGEELENGDLLYVKVTGFNKVGNETETGISNSVIYCNEHPDAEWISVSAGTKSREISAEYKIQPGIGVRSRNWTMEILENTEAGLKWTGIGSEGEDEWIGLAANKGKVIFSVEKLKEEGKVTDGSLIRLRLSVENKAGYETQVTSESIVIDDSAPPVPVVMDQGDIINQVRENVITADWSTTFNDAESGSTYYWRWYFAGDNKNNVPWTEAEWNKTKTEQYKSANLGNEIKNEKYDGRTLYYEVKAVNGAGMESIGISDGILLDSNAPVVEELKIFVSEKMDNASQIGGYTEKSVIKNSIYVKISAEDMTSWTDEAEVVLCEIGVDGKETEKITEKIKIENESANAVILITDVLELEEGSRFRVKATAKDAAGNRSASAISECIVITGNAAAIKQISLQGDTKKLNVSWINDGDSRWTKEYLVSIKTTTNGTPIIYNCSSALLSVTWEEIGIDISKKVNGSVVQVTVTPVGYISGNTGNAKTESFTIDFSIPEFIERDQCIPEDRELTAWADSVTGFVKYRTGQTGVSVEWASTYVEDGSELTSWVKKNNSSSLTVRKNITELANGKGSEFWHNKKVMLRFRAVNMMGLSSPETKTAPVLIDIREPEKAEISRAWKWTKENVNISSMIIRGADSESGISAYKSALIKKEKLASSAGLQEVLDDSGVSRILVTIDKDNVYENNNASIQIIGADEGSYVAVLGVRSGSGLWTYVTSSEIIIDRTVPVYKYNQSKFEEDGKKEEIHIINGPNLGYTLVSNEDVLWTVHVNGQNMTGKETKDYLNNVSGNLDFSDQSNGVVYTMKIKMKDRAGNESEATELIRYNRAPVVSVLYDNKKNDSDPNMIVVWPGHKKSISSLFNVLDAEDESSGDFPLSFTWNPGNGDGTYSWTGGNSVEEIFGNGGVFETTYHQKDEKAQISEYTGVLTVKDCYGKESVTQIVVTVENTRSGELIENEYWTGDYEIIGMVIVPEEITLTVEDIDITASGYSEGKYNKSGFEVNGLMSVEGDVIIESVRKNVKWKGIKVNGNLNGDSLKVVNTENGMVLSDSGNLILNKIIIEDCDKTALEVSGNITVEEILISGITGTGITVNGKLTTDGSIIVEGTGSDGLKTGEKAEVEANEIKISGFKNGINNDGEITAKEITLSGISGTGITVNGKFTTDGSIMVEGTGSEGLKAGEKAEVEANEIKVSGFKNGINNDGEITAKEITLSGITGTGVTVNGKLTSDGNIMVEGTGSEGLKTGEKAEVKANEIKVSGFKNGINNDGGITAKEITLSEITGTGIAVNGKLISDGSIMVKGTGSEGLKTGEKSELETKDIKVSGFARGLLVEGIVEAKEIIEVKGSSKYGIKNEGSIYAKALVVKNATSRGYVATGGSHTEFEEAEVSAEGTGIHCVGNAEADFGKCSITGGTYGIKTDKDNSGEPKLKLSDGSCIISPKVRWYDYKDGVLTDDEIIGKTKK